MVKLAKKEKKRVGVKKKIDISKLKIELSQKLGKKDKVTVEEEKAEDLEKGKSEEEERVLDNILSFSEGEMIQRGSRFRSNETPVRNLEQDIAIETGNQEGAKKVDEKNLGYVTKPDKDYMISPMAGEDEGIRRRNREETRDIVLNAKRLEFGGPANQNTRILDVGDFQRNAMSSGGGGDYETYVTYAVKKDYETNLPFEQREKRRKL